MKEKIKDMRITIYGFKSFLDYKENITEKIIKKIKNKKNLKKIVFNVEFNKNQFLKEIKKSNPDIIIGLGQYSRGEKIRIERKAINAQRKNEEKFSKKINKKGLKYLFTNLKLKKDSFSWISYYAGDYVCNFSMYIISDFIKNKNIKYAFIHIPKDFKLSEAVEFVEKRLKNFQY